MWYDFVAYSAAKFGCALEINSLYKDGDALASNTKLLTLLSSNANLAMLERTLLNFLRHLTAIASLTRQFVELIKHTQCQILETRKTTPGLRHLEKYAVKCGGGVNHRQGLYDMIMLKDTHIDLLGGIEKALLRLPPRKDLPVIVEVRDLAELKIALSHQHKIDRILLENMRGLLLRECVQLCKQYNMPTEASGNLTLTNISEVAASGVDFASVGMLTHSVKQVDLSMKIDS